MSEATIKLGYEVGSGAEVRIPLKHMAITGQTQESGKTTTLEALITRSCADGGRTPLRAIAFITKRGEGSFISGQRIPPFFRERADWEFVESLIAATMKKRMNFERAWIYRAAAGAKTLSDVRRNVEREHAKAKGGMNKDMFMLLGAYLDKVLPVLSRLPRADRLALSPGLNVMDLAAYPEELQALVISSTLQQIYEHERGVVTVIPEAWKFVPQGRKTPVTLVVEHLAREGAGLKNFLWIDSQDMAGVEKLALRAAAVWLIGVQREINEVKRALGSIPAAIKKPKASDVATLGLGQFFACHKDVVQRVYVQPAWLLDDYAREVAMGRMSPAKAAKYAPPAPRTVNQARAELEIDPPKEDAMDETLRAENAQLKQQVADLTEEVRALRRREGAKVLGVPESALAPAPPLQSSAQPERMTPGGEAAAQRIAARERPASVLQAGDLDLFEEQRILGGRGLDLDDIEKLYQAIRRRLIEEEPPAVLKALLEKPELQVTVKRSVIEADAGTQRGQIALLISEGFFDQPKPGGQALKELARRGQAWNFGRFAQELSEIARMGFLYVTEGKDERSRAVSIYQAVPGMKVNIRELEPA